MHGRKLATVCLLSGFCARLTEESPVCSVSANTHQNPISEPNYFSLHSTLPSSICVPAVGPTTRSGASRFVAPCPGGTSPEARDGRVARDRRVAGRSRAASRVGVAIHDAWRPRGRRRRRRGRRRRRRLDACATAGNAARAGRRGRAGRPGRARPVVVLPYGADGRRGPGRGHAPAAPGHPRRRVGRGRAGASCRAGRVVADRTRDLRRGRLGGGGGRRDGEEEEDEERREGKKTVAVGGRHHGLSNGNGTSCRRMTCSGRPDQSLSKAPSAAGPGA
ncbi:hypothetical protein L209DRAFT_347165 [Thermothelomyces heterothallicus CBS 203.75]